MKQFAKVMLLALGFGILAVVLSSLPTRPVGATGSAPVTVTNTPLPVSGNVNATISGTPTVNLGAGNTVGINGSVQVGNNASSPVLVRDVENPAREPFQDAGVCSLTPGNDTCGASITVPANKRLVVETVTATVHVPSGQQVLTEIETCMVGFSCQFFDLAVTPQGTFGGQDVFVGTHSLRLYADPGPSVSVSLARNATVGTADLVVRISGHLVDCGAGTGCPVP